MIAYWDNGDSTVRYRTYDGTTISGESSISIAKSRWVALYPQPGTDNIMLIALLDAKDIEVTLWNGSSWGTVYSQETDTGYNTEDCFDFAWEQLSGDGLLTYAENGAVEPRYRTWIASTWSSEFMLPSVGKKQHFHRLAADPLSDQILFASLFQPRLRPRVHRHADPAASPRATRQRRSNRCRENRHKLIRFVCEMACLARVLVPASCH